MGAFREMLTSEGKNGSKLSSKRVITFIAFICVVIAFFGSVAFALVVDTTVLNGMISIVYAGLGVTVGEHLLRRRNGENPNGIDEPGYNDDTSHNGHPHHNDVDTQHHDHLGDN